MQFWAARTRASCVNQRWTDDAGWMTSSCDVMMETHHSITWHWQHLGVLTLQRRGRTEGRTDHHKRCAAAPTRRRIKFHWKTKNTARLTLICSNWRQNKFQSICTAWGRRKGGRGVLLLFVHPDSHNRKPYLQKRTALCSSKDASNHRKFRKKKRSQTSDLQQKRDGFLSGKNIPRRSTHVSSKSHIHA